MADTRTVDEIAKNIVRNLVPFNAGEDLMAGVDKAQELGVRVLRALGVMPPAPPPLNAPLPKYDPATGRIIQPGEGR